jgi:MFS family permease
VSRRSVLVVVTLASAIIAVLLAGLIVTDIIQVWMLYPIALAEGITAAIGQPARQVMVYDVVENEDLANAVAVNSLGGNTMRIVGPSLAGALIGTAGIESAFAVQAVAYLFSVYATSRIRTRGEPSGVSSMSVLASLADGIAYARRNHDVWLLVVMSGLPSLLVYPYVQYIPVFAEDVLHVGSLGFGFLASAVATARSSARSGGEPTDRRRGHILIWTTPIYVPVTAFALRRPRAVVLVLVIAGMQLDAPDEPGDDPAVSMTAPRADVAL